MLRCFKFFFWWKGFHHFNNLILIISWIKMLNWRNLIKIVFSKQVEPCFLCKRFVHLITKCMEKTRHHVSIIESNNVEVKLGKKFKEFECSLLEVFFFPKLNRQILTYRILIMKICGLYIGQKLPIYVTTITFLNLKPVADIWMSLTVWEKEISVEGIGAIFFYIVKLSI